MTKPSNSWRKLAAISAFALLAACGSSRSTQQQAQVSTAPSNTSAFMHSPTSAGTVLTTANGMTLYTYDKDTVGQSACYGDCAQYWHPYLSNGTSMPSGKMTLVTRSDGSQQWAYDGKPLYTFSPGYERRAGERQRLPQQLACGCLLRPQVAALPNSDQRPPPAPCRWRAISCRARAVRPYGGGRRAPAAGSRQGP